MAYVSHVARSLSEPKISTRVLLQKVCVTFLSPCYIMIVHSYLYYYYSYYYYSS